ncbi:hypothetical protein [Streptomyces chengmaiensis]|uniref:hypothetical protein n=1 Tax=Streptomyces chengmaiensis TaxID=3040919 RepID=UPI0037D9E1D7
MRPHDAVTPSAAPSVTAPAAPPGSIGLEQAEAALVEHYPRLVRIAYLVLPPSLGRNRRVLSAHALVQRSLPRGRGGRPAAIPAQASPPAQASQSTQASRPGPGHGPGYAYVREQVLRQALDAGLPLKRPALPRRAQLPPLLPQVWGLRMFPRSGGADELALDQRLSALSGPARAAYVLRCLERLSDTEVRRTLTACDAADPHAALAEANAMAALETAEGRGDSAVLLESPEFDPCSLQVRPTDLMRRRQHLKAALLGTAAAAVCAALLGLPDDGRGPDGAAAPPYARHPAAEAALDPAKLTKAADASWRRASRLDYSVWPARGALTGDRELLRRALAVWARPGGAVQVSATPGTPAGPPMGAPQLLYAGEVDQARVVLLYDGLRVVRYAEPKDGAGGSGAAAALDLARTDAASAGALVVGRSDGNVRYLTAPWVRGTAVRDLLKPSGGASALPVGEDGVTAPVPSPAAARECRSWEALELTEDDAVGRRAGSGTAAVRTVTDLGELTPARLTSGKPGAPQDPAAAGTTARQAWARTACLLPGMRAHGVRGVRLWEYARQPLPEGDGTAAWLCTRAETWRGAGGRVLAQIQAPGVPEGAPGAVAARAEDSPACGEREPRVLAGVLWKSRAGHWYVLAAGSEEFASVGASGGVTGSAKGRLLAVKAGQGARAELTGRLKDGTRVDGLR